MLTACPQPLRGSWEGGFTLWILGSSGFLLGVRAASGFSQDPHQEYPAPGCPSALAPLFLSLALPASLSHRGCYQVRAPLRVSKASSLQGPLGSLQLAGSRPRQLLSTRPDTYKGPGDCVTVQNGLPGSWGVLRLPLACREEKEAIDKFLGSPVLLPGLGWQ